MVLHPKAIKAAFPKEETIGYTLSHTWNTLKYFPKYLKQKKFLKRLSEQTTELTIEGELEESFLIFKKNLSVLMEFHRQPNLGNVAYHISFLERNIQHGLSLKFQLSKGWPIYNQFNYTLYDLTFH